MKKRIIALVGRPNVGKSSLFNDLSGERISIVDDQPGVTRDRIFSSSEWYGKQYEWIDTGGIEMDTTDPLLIQMRRQVELAIDLADGVIFLCDGKDGLTAGDREIAQMLRQTGLPVLLALNKCDTPGQPPDTLWDFYELGLGDPIQLSAAHKMGLSELFDAIEEQIPEKEEAIPEPERIRVAIIGKPNVGKSSLVNRLLNEERSIVSDIAGTTRDALDIPFENEEGQFLLIDTAGLRKKSRVEDSVEKYSVLRTQRAVERADVCLILIDALAGITEQDTKVAGLAHNAGKASIFVLNKWDAVGADEKTFRQFEKMVEDRFPFMTYAPVTSISALTGQRVTGLFPLINHVYQETSKRLSTGVINEVLSEAVGLHRPPQDKGRSLKLFYATQVSSNPPQIVVFINDQKLLHFSYERYLENRFREAFGFEGSPLRLIWRERRKTDYIRVAEPTQSKEVEDSEGDAVF